MELKSILFRWI